MDRSKELEQRVNPGYARWQIAKALTTSGEHADLATRERAREKVAKWVRILNGLINGSNVTGLRTPLSGVPAWVTLEVATGGFATGELLAGGPIRQHERQLLSAFSLAPNLGERLALNQFFLTDDGLAQLQNLLSSGHYDIDVPEEGALLVVAWLTSHDQIDAARGLLDELGPFLSSLRFYPRPAEQPQRINTQVHVQDVATTIESLQKIGPNRHILAQKEAIEVWTPIYDTTVALFLETLDGDQPTLMTTDPGAASTDSVIGGWPCQVYPEGWLTRAKQLLSDYAASRQIHRLCNKPARKKGTFFQLRQFLSRCVEDADSLSHKDIARIRQLLARYITRWGVPGSVDSRAIRLRQSQQSLGPTYQELSQVVAARLAAFKHDGGIDNIETVLCPTTVDEAKKYRLASGVNIPDSIKRKVERCLNGAADELIRRGIITSAETLARVLPQFTSGLRAAGIIDPALRNLYSAVYRAFRRRRSLLLLNFENQVKIEELPWVAAIDRFRSRDLADSELAKETLQEVTALTLISFPQVILPNKLLQELRGLAKQANLDLPLVDELAADIFMGQFTGKFVAAAKVAAKLLAKSLYATYYEIDYALIEQLPDARQTSQKSWFRPSKHNGETSFATLCQSRAGATTAGWDVAVKGMIIEQQQIITTQNLAALISGLDLLPELRGQFITLARRCFEWICKRQQQNSPNWHAMLISLKNTAYAWRQMIFFLSLASASDVSEFLAWTNEYISRQRPEFQERFRPAIQGLCRAAAGKSPELDNTARRLLGWTKDRHWLLGPKPQR